MTAITVPPKTVFHFNETQDAEVVTYQIQVSPNQGGVSIEILDSRGARSLVINTTQHHVKNHTFAVPAGPFAD
jgi:hypothetical protein